jgi:hypothetical protein
MVTRYIALFFLSLYAFTLFKPLGPLGDYMLRYQTYSEELCENKNQPELQCHGTCQLAQILQLEEESSSNQPALPLSEGLSFYVAPFHQAQAWPKVERQNCLYPLLEQQLRYSLFLEQDTPPPRV